MFLANIISVESRAHSSRQRCSICILLMAVVHPLLPCLDSMIFSMPSRILSLVDLTESICISSISVSTSVKSRLLPYGSDEVDVSPRLPGISQSSNAFTICLDRLWFSDLLNEVIFTSIPVYKILFLRFRAPLLMRWYTINRELISKLNCLSKFNHRFSLSFSWFVVSNESYLNKPVVILAPLISGSYTFLISGIRNLAIGFDYIMISNMINAILIFMTFLNRRKLSVFIGSSIMKFNSFYFIRSYTKLTFFFYLNVFISRS